MDEQSLGHTGAYGGTVRRASSSAGGPSPAVTFSVSGNAAWVSTLGPNQGLAQVQVDNGKPEVVDLYSPTVQTRASSGRGTPWRPARTRSP